MVERVDRRPVDSFLLATLVLLVGMGLSVLFSASYFRADRLFGEPTYFLRRQIVWLVLGMLGAFTATRVSLEALRKVIPLLLVPTLAFMLLSFVPRVGVQVLGARRWIVLFGYSFQPSELVKLSLILYLSHILSRKREQFNDPINAILPPVLVAGFFVALIYAQNDFSTAFFVLLVTLLMFFVSGFPLRYFLSMTIMSAPIATILLLSREHRVRRVLAFVDPGRDPAGTGYQILASQGALADGGLWGVGIGRSVRKLGGLPEAHSDFVFAVLGEEFGYIGVVVVLGLFAVFAYRGFSLAFRLEDSFRSFLAFGLTAGIALQAALNMAVVVGMVPATGIPLPFFSSGGSSIVVSLVMAGLLLNLSRDASVSEGGVHG
ncbi:MAG: putative lipid II flippase FtsW [Spirochaetaceae bacterium]|nr:MAG: putative lipid II flippase FtsW [Spirochaetaceae bacterium]